MNVLRNRWALGGLGVAAFAAATWFAGDLLVLSAWRPLELSWTRVLLAAIVAGAWVALELARTRRARRENGRLLDLLAGSDGDSVNRAAHEIATLQKRFEEAAAILRSARFRGPDGEQRYVQELPWYVFIGAPGSGKTTALVNSGLKFPLKSAGGDPSLAGVGGTRNCDWWFTEDAVLLDTAGRYTTQESDLQADAAAWSGFLELLKRFRPRQPLNGALVTLSISDLMLWSDEERKRYAWHVRARVAELYDRLGVRFPLYLVVTKTDLLAGFMELFGDLDAVGRARVWGASFEAPGGFVMGTPGQRFSEEFAGLERRLYDELLGRLEGEPDLQRRAAAYRFPQEFRTLGPLIDQFLDSAFLGVQGASEPMLRGVYFTSGTQEGNPIDRVLGSLARSFRLERAAPVAGSGGGKSFFLMRLLREVIFLEAGLAGMDEQVEQRARRNRRLAYGAIAAMTVAVGALWTLGYVNGRNFIAAAHAQAEAARDELKKSGALPPGSEAKLVDALSTLRELPGGYRDREKGLDSGAGFGLSQRPKLGGQALRAYEHGLREALLPRLAMAIEDDMRATLRMSNSQEGLAASLAAYQALYGASGADSKAIETVAAKLWKLNAAGRAELADHLRAAFAQGHADVRHPRDEVIIRDASRRLEPAKPA